MIKFSVITCTYQAEAVCQRTFDSVLEQTYPYVEHLILDGASKDRTVEMAKAYQEENDEGEDGHDVVIVSEPDRGLYDAMNKGIQKATGDFLVFLNAGDVLPSKDTLESIANSVGDGEDLPGVLYGDTDIVNEDGRFLRHRRLAPPKKLTWRSFKWGMLVCHQAFYVRADLARRNLYNLNYKYSADFDWCIRVMKDAERCHLPLWDVNEVVANYLEGGMSIQHHRDSLKERFRVMRQHYGLVTTVLVHVWFIFRSVLKK